MNERHPNNTIRKLYIDGRGFLHKVEGDVNVKLQTRVVGRSLEFKIKDPATIARLGRDIVLVPLSDLLDLIEKVDNLG